MGNLYSYGTSSPEAASWEVTANLSPTISYKLKKGETTVIKTTGVAPNTVSYEVNAKDGRMALIKDASKIEAGFDGNLPQLVEILESMIVEIKTYTTPVA